MFLCLNQPHYPRRSQFLPFQHLQPLLLLQFEQSRIDMEFVGTAMEDDISNGDASRVLTEVAKDALSITLLIVFVHIWLFKYYFSVNKAM